MKLNYFSQSFDRTLRHYGITGKALWEKTGISQNHISEFRNGGNISAVALSSLMAAMEDIAPGAKLYFCLLLAGEDPTELLSQPRTNLRSLVLSASAKEKAEVLNLIAGWVLESRDSTGTERIAEAV